MARPAIPLMRGVVEPSVSGVNTVRIDGHRVNRLVVAGVGVERNSMKNFASLSRAVILVGLLFPKVCAMPQRQTIAKPIAVWLSSSSAMPTPV